MENFKMIAKTFFGFEDILAEELKNLGAQNIEKGTRMVSFYGDTGFMYKANLALRTALKVLKPIYQFEASNEHQLYKGIQSVQWSDYMNVNETFLIDSTIYSDHFNHANFVALKAKDAIVDQFRTATGLRPSIDKNFPKLRIAVHVQNKTCTVSLDSSGASLHHRGYRTVTNIAPINEVLAAGILLLSGWKGTSDFLDPMCGSGTFLIEAAMIACEIPANINRKEFAFEKWNDWDSKLFDVVLESLLKKTKECNYRIIGYDKAPSAIIKSEENIKNANLQEYITIKGANFFESKKETDTFLHLTFNPPYGERLTVDFETFYKNIGDTLKQNYPNSAAWFITSNLEALKHIGLRPSRKIKLFNGSLESKLVKLDIYEGSKKSLPIK
jgi:putative N6-adenine-specific DNA methylase